MRISPDIVVARGFWGRLKGLMLSAALPPDTAFLLPNCSSVHTCFMRYALDIVYLDERGCVVELARNVKPWRMAWGGRKATQTLEMAAGGIERHGMKVGNFIALPPASGGYRAR